MIDGKGGNAPFFYGLYKMNKNNEIILSVKRSIHRNDDPRKDYANEEYKKIRPSILARDKHTCQYCNFRSKKFQEVHHIDDDHSNNVETNLITTCPLCHACFHVVLSGLHERGVIIHLEDSPGVSQTSLINMVRTMWIGESSKDKDVQMLSTNMLAKLYKQSVAASKVVGTSSTVAFGQNLLRMSDDDYKSRQSMFKNFFFLPLRGPFEAQISHWSDEVYSSFGTDNWLSSVKTKLSRWAEVEYGSSDGANIIKLLTETK